MDNAEYRRRYEELETEREEERAQHDQKMKELNRRQEQLFSQRPY